MDTVRVGIIGHGGMGSHHAQYIQAGKISRARLGAVCDIDAKRLASPPGGVKTFEDSRALIRSGEVDAVIVATPHYDHTTIGIDALEQGLHVLVEKPISVHKGDCQRLIAAHAGRTTVFAAMFNQRTSPVYRKVRQMMQRGDLGELRRVNWIITDWFRTEAYYASGGWRATWGGEGGGVLLNQCPHQLDLLQWMFGMPCRISGFCQFGARHRIEVEDEVTAFLEYPNGATGVFITSTGEAPGTNRLEVVGEMGRLVVDDRIRFTRNEVPMGEFSRTSKQAFARPETWEIEVPASGGGGQHMEITQNFVNAILDGTPLIAPAPEGIGSVEIANAILLSAWTGAPVALPLDADVYARELQQRSSQSRFQKTVIAKPDEDLSKTFGSVK